MITTNIWTVCVLRLIFAIGKKNQRKGNGLRSLLIYPYHNHGFGVMYWVKNMANEAQLDVIERMVQQLLLEKPELFLVQVRIKPTNNIKVFLDGDAGVTIEACTKINRKLYTLIEEAGMYPEGDFSLEVSSPGIGEPLLLHRQYKKNIGRWLLLTLENDYQVLGELKEVTEDGIVVEETKGKGKKMEIVFHSLLFEQIKKASVEAKF